MELQDLRPSMPRGEPRTLVRVTLDAWPLEMLSHRECLQLLTGAQVGRVVFTAAALPAVVPVTFAILDNAVVMCTAPDTRLAAAADGGVLAFEIDEVEPRSRTGWSVVVTGVAELMTDPLMRSRIHGMVAPWAPGRHDVFIRLPLTVVSGRRIPTPSSSPVGSADG